MYLLFLIHFMSFCIFYLVFFYCYLSSQKLWANWKIFWWVLKGLRSKFDFIKNSLSYYFSQLTWIDYVSDFLNFIFSILFLDVFFSIRSLSVSFLLCIMTERHSWMSLIKFWQSLQKLRFQNVVVIKSISDLDCDLV